ncbi:hypothetical protein [Plantactinospora sp. DSM 117369]
MNIATSQPHPAKHEASCPDRPQQDVYGGIGWSSAETPTSTVAGTAGKEPLCQLIVAGEPIEVWVESLDTGLVRIDLCTTGGMGCGEAELADGELRVDLPGDWSVADKATVTCLIARIAYAVCAT